MLTNCRMGDLQKVFFDTEPVKKTKKEWTEVGGEPGKTFLESNRENSRSFKRTQEVVEMLMLNC